MGRARVSSFCTNQCQTRIALILLKIGFKRNLVKQNDF
jgi:hypothetical protein